MWLDLLVREVYLASRDQRNNGASGGRRGSVVVFGQDLPRSRTTQSDASVVQCTVWRYERIEWCVWSKG